MKILDILNFESALYYFPFVTRHRRDREDLDYQFGIVRVAGVCWAGYWAAEPLWDVGLAWAPPMLGWPGLATWPGIVVMGSANNMPVYLIVLNPPFPVPVPLL